MEKVGKKQGSSGVVISILMMAAFFRHCTRAAAVAADRTADKHSTVTVHSLICRAVIWTYVIDEGLSTMSDPGASLMPTKQVTAQIEQHSTVQGKWFTTVCPVRTNPQSGCCQLSTAAGITKPEAKCVDDSWSCESDDESADDTNTTKQEELPTSFTDRLGTDQKTSKKEVIAPLPSPRRKLCLENKDGNTENVYLVFQEEALGTHKHLDFHALVPWCNRCWWNALLLSLVEPATHQNHTKLSTWSQVSAPTHQLHQQNRRGNLIFSLPLFISI